MTAFGAILALDLENGLAAGQRFCDHDGPVMGLGGAADLLVDLHCVLA
jgi:hypothetical protein